MTTTLLKSLGFLLLGASMAAAADAPAAKGEIHWKKITLSREFLSEGANFGDFNHDGKVDVVSGPYWYEGPDFTTRHEYMKPEPKLNPDGQYSHNFFAYSYSFKNDGWDDILIIGFPGEDTSWYENPRGQTPPDGHWVRHKILDVTDNESPTFADLLGNGKPVLICMTKGKAGYAQPDWSDPGKPWTFHPIGPDKKYQRFTHGLGFGDVNGDGKNDILVGDGWYEQPATLDGDPLWTFHPFKFADPGGSQMFVYDVNGDGKPDVITALQAHGYGVVWWELKEPGNFEKHVIVGKTAAENPQGVVFSEPHAIDFVDINGDGLPDIVTGKRWYAHGSNPKGDPDAQGPAVLYWFELKRENGKVEWIAHKIDDDSGVGTQAIAADAFHTKHPAIVIGNKKGTFVFVQE
ncbi:MAG TPA: VCBS repeat-containing protein [Humisphaera sp.]|nr:VCBS repeat-containing protein [Humisphaera sp.]